MPRDLSRLLRPQSIAVLGGGWAANVIEQCDKIGFAGEVWPVHPTRDEIGGRKCFKGLSDLPRPPDMTFVGVNRHTTLDMVAELSTMGAGGAICFASGWAETGDDHLQAALVAAAGDMPILGPNCYGLLNMLDGAVIWPDQHGAQRCEEGVAILSQSSNIAINLTMQARGLPIAYVACLGNAAQTGMVDLAEAMLADARVTALGIYAEGFDDPVGLAAVTQAARAMGKGTVILKSGRSAGGVAAAASHTAVLSGTHAASRAFLKQAGISAVASPSELIDALKILHTHGPLLCRQVCALACSGGEAGLVADLADGRDLNFTPLTEAQKTGLADILGPLVTLSNPLDYQTFIWGDLAKTTDVFAQTLAPYDAGLFIIDPPRNDRCDPASFEPALDAIVAASARTGKPAFAVASMPENIDEGRAKDLLVKGVVTLHGVETALAAIEAVSQLAESDWAPWPAQPEKQVSLLDEATAKTWLADAGIRTPIGVTARSLQEATKTAADLTPPLALKGLGFAHKTEAGAVRLGLKTLADVSEIPDATGYLIEEMVTDALAELIISVQRDPVYGATMMLGFGGTEAELLADTQTLVLPVTTDEITAALGRLRLAPLLHGYRGRPKADVEAVVQTALTLQDMLRDTPSLTEIEINPLMVRHAGAVAVDALIRKEL
ncbi:MAG: acetate--CoA ligase family protein [Pseudomonadota bacterium]